MNLASLGAVVFNQHVNNSLPRSSSGFCENFAGRGSSNVDQMENSRSEHIVDSASFYLDVNSNGDLVTRALADLDLSSSIELLSAGGYNNDNQLSIISCDTAELLRTPSPCVVESDQEVEPAAACAAGVKAKDQSSGENGVKAQDEQDQWAASHHNDNSKGFCMQMDKRRQSVEDIPATSTPKKHNAVPSDFQEILEGRYKGSAYHRDGTRVGGYHSNQRKCFLFSFFFEYPESMPIFAVSFFHQMCSVTCASTNSLMEALCSARGSVDLARRWHCCKLLIYSNLRPVLERLVKGRV